MVFKINVNGVERAADVDGDTPLARLRRAHSTHYETALAIFRSALYLACSANTLNCQGAWSMKRP